MLGCDLTVILLSSIQSEIYAQRWDSLSNESMVYFPKDLVPTTGWISAQYANVLTYTSKYALTLLIPWNYIKYDDTSINVFWKKWNIPSYLYLGIRPNTLLYVINVFMRKYAHITLYRPGYETRLNYWYAYF